MTKPTIRNEGEGEKRWFFGGGVHTWKATAEETNGSFFVIEDRMEKGKTTPLHSHPDHDELVYVLEGEILYRGGGLEQRVARGGTIVTPRGVEHAFTVVSDSARFLFMQTPGSGETFYRQASEPGVEGTVDFRKIGAAAEATGVTKVLGPPPFGKG